LSPRKVCIFREVSKISYSCTLPLIPYHAVKGEQIVALFVTERPLISWRSPYAIDKSNWADVAQDCHPESFCQKILSGACDVPNPFLTSDNFSKALSGDNSGFSKDLVY
jgi:hypothetical protein